MDQNQKELNTTVKAGGLMVEHCICIVLQLNICCRYPSSSVLVKSSVILAELRQCNIN